MYGILLIVGLSIGGIFLAVLLIGDKREARREAQRKAMQERNEDANQTPEGTWPPPPSTSVYQSSPQPPPPSPAKPASRKNATMVRTFSFVRNYAIGAILVSYIIYGLYPKLNFVWVLLGTAIVFALLAFVLTKLKKTRKG